MPPIIVRTLSREYRLHVEAPEHHQALRFMEIAPEIVGRQLEPVDIRIDVLHGQLSMAVPQGRTVQGSADHLLAILHGIIFDDLLASEPGAPLLHGATVIVQGRRMLLIGDKTCGKTTLSLHLAANAYRVEGDEHLVIGTESVIARPRTLRVKPGTLALVAGLPDSVWQAPSVATWDGSLIRAVRPDIAGQGWTIAAGRLDAIVSLSANHGGRSLAKPIAGDPAFRDLMAQTIMPTTGIPGAAMRVRRLATNTPAFKLLLGDLAGAEWHLNSIARGLTAAPR